MSLFAKVFLRYKKGEKALVMWKLILILGVTNFINC
jgi:hypothetical protein